MQTLVPALPHPPAAAQGMYAGHGELLSCLHKPDLGRQALPSEAGLVVLLYCPANDDD